MKSLFVFFSLALVLTSFEVKAQNSTVVRTCEPQYNKCPYRGSECPAHYSRYWGWVPGACVEESDYGQDHLACFTCMYGA